MKTWITILCLIMLPICMVGQDVVKFNPVKPDIVPLKKNIEPLRKDSLHQGISVDYYDIHNADYLNNRQNLKSESNTLSISPSVNNSSENMGFYPTWLNASGYDNDVPGIINYRSADFSSAFTYDRLNLSAGTSLSKFGSWGYSGNDVSFNGALSFDVTNWLTAGFFGNYALATYSNLLYPLAPTDNYGGFVKLRLNDKWSVIAEYGKEYNPRKGKWQKMTRVYPCYEINTKGRSKIQSYNYY